MKWLAIICVMCLVPDAWSANILVLEGVPSPSHHIYIATLSQALAARGHNVTSISADLDDYKTPNLTYLHLDKVQEYLEASMSEKMADRIENGQTNPWIVTIMLPLYMLDFLDAEMQSTGFRQLLDYPDDFKFDLVLYDFFLGPSLLPFVHKFKNPPLIGLTAFYSTSTTASFVGSVFNPAFVPFGFIDSFTLTSFCSRLNNYLMYMTDYIVRELIATPIFQYYAAKEFPGLPSLGEIQQQMKLVILNRDPTTDYIEPLLPNVISAGGMQIQGLKALPGVITLYQEHCDK